jgi:hypothetical protein
MANSKLLKEAIADAKAVRETAIANAKIALEEAFTPRLQSILSKKLQAEMAEEDDDLDQVTDGDEEVTEEEEEEEAPVEEPVDEEEEEELPTEEEPMEEEEEEGHTEPDGDEDGSMPADGDEDDLDLEAIIRELEGESDEEEPMEEEEGCTECGEDQIAEDDDEELDLDIEDDETEPVQEEEDSDEDDTIDLDEILREMGYGDDEEEVKEEEEADKTDELEAELDEAYKTIKSLKNTINEVNLLNAKLLYSNKLFRSYNLTNEQKIKVVENLDRTNSVREVKLVYATLAESMKFTGTERKVSVKKAMTEGFASKATKSTAPKKEIISESSDAMANRFKQLAGIK